ncbi:protein NO VEIN domain-containing protein [Arthrobacter sp. MDT3-44]
MSPTQYATALGWLRDLKLLEPRKPPIPPANLILGAIFENAAPTWVQDADELVRSPDELPSDIVSAGDVLGLDSNGVYEQLITSWGKVDTTVRERVGAAGEAALVTLLREGTNGRVDHVSTWSDGFGYDIAFAQGTVSAHLEVKSTTRAGRFTAYLSRHECSVMLRDEQWVLVAVRLTAKHEIIGVGSVPQEWIAANVPRDSGPFGSWASCKLEIPAEIIEHQVPQLGQDAASKLPPWHTAQ